MKAAHLWILMFFGPFLIGGLVIFTLSLPLPNPWREWLFRGVLGGSLGLYFIFLFWAIWQIALGIPFRQMNEVMTPLGFKSQTPLLWSKFSGDWGDYPATLSFTPGRTQGFLEIRLMADLPHQAGMARQVPLYGCRDCTPLSQPPSALAELSLSSQNPAWLTEILADSAAQSALLRLLDSPLGVQTVYFQPEGIWLQARPGAVRLDSLRLEQLLNDLQVLLDSASSANSQTIGR